VNELTVVTTQVSGHSDAEPLGHGLPPSS